MTPASVIRAIASPVRALVSPLLQDGAASSAAPAASAAAAPASAAAAPSSATSSLGTASNAGATIANAKQSLGNDQETFFKLLTAQLRNQDPLSPLDANAFTQQLVAMTGVQQQILTNQLLNEMVSGQAGVGNAVGLIGKSVTAATSASTLNDGAANWNYSLDSNAKDITIQVVDSLGNVVFQTTQSNLQKGGNSFTWDGKDLTGNQRADGTVYGLRVTATDTAGQPVGSYVSLKGIARSIETINGQTVVEINGTKVPLNLITGVSTPT